MKRITIFLLIIALQLFSAFTQEQKPAPTKAKPSQATARKPSQAKTTEIKPSELKEEVLDNNAIIALVSAGLPEDIIIQKIRTTERRNFDLTANGLVQLSKAKVSPRIIKVMMDPNTPDIPGPAATLAQPTTSASDREPTTKAESDEASNSSTKPIPAIVTSDEGLYYISNESEVIRIEAKTPYQTRTGSVLASALTLGIKPARLNAMLPGLRADLQVTGTPQFYLNLSDGESVGEYYLVRFTVKEQRGRREIEVGSKSFFKAQAGFPEKDLFLLESERLQKDIYLVRPKSALPGGEYGILQIPRATAEGQTSLTPRRIYDFGVR